MSSARPRFMSSRPWRTGTVWAVGRRVFVHCPSGNTRAVRLTTSEDGDDPAGSLVDGSEVEVVAWRPRGAAGTRYRVRGSDGLTGWLSTTELRGTMVAPPPPPPEHVADVIGTPMSATRFGARR
jgi:hypothetical protein